MRLDPLFPWESKVQTDEDIVNILDKSQGVQCVISKPLRLVIPRKGMTNPFFNEMRDYYEGGRKNGIEWHNGRYVYSPERCETELAFLSKECKRRNIPLLHCKETVLVDEGRVPLIRRKLGNRRDGAPLNAEV